MKKAFIVFLLFGFSFLAFAQQKPILGVTRFYCDNEDTFVLDRENKCEIYLQYKPAKNVGLDRIEGQLMHDYRLSSNNSLQKETGRLIEWSKLIGNFSVQSMEGNMFIVLPFRMTLRTEDCSQGILGIGALGGCAKHGRLYYLIRNKLTISFTDGQQIKTEVSIRVR